MVRGKPISLIPRQNRLCSCCSDIEDEAHFMLHCTKNQSQRTNLFNKLTHLDISSPDLNLLKILLNPESKEHCANVCTFITNSLAAM